MEQTLTVRVEFAGVIRVLDAPTGRARNGLYSEVAVHVEQRGQEARIGRSR